MLAAEKAYAIHLWIFQVLGHWRTRLAAVARSTHKTDTLAAITYEQAALEWVQLCVCVWEWEIVLLLDDYAEMAA